MTSINIVTVKNAQAGKITLPKQFSEPVRRDLIERAVLSLQAAARQAYGGYGGAGMRHSSRVSKRRKDYRGSYGMGISRVPRKVHIRRGKRMVWVGATVAGTVGGRRAHGPKPFKDWTQKVNKLENRKAIRSALSATVNKDVVAARGHKIPKEFPFILENAFENVTKTKELEQVLLALGFEGELDRAGVKKVRAGKGKMRGRKHKTPVSFLFVVSKLETPLERAAANLPGATVVPVHMLNAEFLAPGAHPGRLTLYTQSAVERLAKENMFTKEPMLEGVAPVKTAKPVVAKAAPSAPKTEAKPAAKPQAKSPAKKAPAKKGDA